MSDFEEMRMAMDTVEEVKEQIESEKEQDWFFTFGHGHIPNQNYYTVFHGTYESAREQMVATYGLKWAFQYPSAEAAGVDRFNLKLVPF